MADLDYRSPTHDELGDFFAVSLHAYGMNSTDDEIHHETLVYEQGRSYGAQDNDRWVAGAGAFSLEVTVPGGVQVAAAGITMIGVAPTHRRRGILTTLIRQLHEDAIHRGEVLALLTASEASIYRRFGYGVAHPKQWMTDLCGGEAAFPLLILFGLNAVDELDRTAFGKALLDEPTIRFTLADMATALQTSRLLLWHAATALDAPSGTEISAVVFFPAHS